MTVEKVLLKTPLQGATSHLECPLKSSLMTSSPKFKTGRLATGTLREQVLFTRKRCPFVTLNKRQAAWTVLKPIGSLAISKARAEL